MSTSLIKAETVPPASQNEPKTNYRLHSVSNTKKNDLIQLLREENEQLQQSYMHTIKNNIELRAIVEKQQKLITAIYNADLKLIMPADNSFNEILPPFEKNFREDTAANLVEEPTNNLVEELPATPLPLEKLKQAVKSLDTKRQSVNAIAHKTDFILAIYHAGEEGIEEKELMQTVNISGITLYRYETLFNNFGMIRGRRKNNQIYYYLTNKGKIFVQQGVATAGWDPMVHQTNKP